MSMQDYDEALSSGGKENKLYTYNKWKKCVCQEERKQGEGNLLAQLPGGKKRNMGKFVARREMREKWGMGGNLWHGTQFSLWYMRESGGK